MPDGSLTTPGVVEATFEPEMLKLGRLQATGCRSGSDGTMIDTDNADALPSRFCRWRTNPGGAVMLALPDAGEWRQLPEADEVAERPVRFRQRWRDVRNQFGDDTRQCRRHAAGADPPFSHRDNSDYLTCPLVRLQRDSQGHGLSTRRFSRAAADSGQPLAGGSLNCCSRQLRARLARLMAMRRESNERMADFAVADIFCSGC